MANPDSSKRNFFSGDGSKELNSIPYSEAVSRMENSVAELCAQLDHSAEDGMNIDAWITLLEKYIAENSNRLYYSTISNYVFQMDELRFSDFLSNLGKVVDYADHTYHGSKDAKKKNLHRTIIKFYDHANLAHQQQVTFSNKRETLREDVKNEVNTMLEPKVSEINKEMTSQLVGLISIFTALSFIVFGGISSLENMVASLQGTLKDQQSVLPVLILAVAWAFCMMNLLFGFMYFVIRIMHLSKPEDKNAKNAIQRYPIVFLCDYILIALFVLFGGMWFAKKNGVGKNIFDYLTEQNRSTWTFWGFVVLFIAVFAFAGWRLWRWYSPKAEQPKAKGTTEKESGKEKKKA